MKKRKKASKKKDKRIQQLKRSSTAATKGISLNRKEKATIRNKKISKDKNQC